jgi:hypothetical protein
MPFVEHYITLTPIKNIKFVIGLLLVKSNIFWDNIKYTNLNKHRFHNYILSIILFEFRYKFWFIFIIIEFSIKPYCDPMSDPPRPSFGLLPEVGNHLAKVWMNGVRFWA